MNPQQVFSLTRTITRTGATSVWGYYSTERLAKSKARSLNRQSKAATYEVAPATLPEGADLCVGIGTTKAVAI